MLSVQLVKGRNARPALVAAEGRANRDNVEERPGIESPSRETCEAQLRPGAPVAKPYVFMERCVQ